MKKFLLPLDDSIHSMHALQYMAMMAPALKDFIYMLFYVQPTISDYLMEEAKKEPKASEKLKQLEQHNVRLGAEILKRHKEWLMHQNVTEEKIMVVTQRRKEGLARDIIHQAYSELVDAITIGRRGFSSFQETFIGSTTKNVVEHSADIPVCVVDGEISAKEILLAVDGSTDSFKALEYLCGVLRDDPELILTLFHVQPSLRDCCGIDVAAVQTPEDEKLVCRVIEKADRQCIENFMDHALRKFKENKIDKDKLKIKVQPTKLNIGKTIAEEFRNGRYGTLVVGKRGVNKRFFMGSVSHYLVTHLQNGALWMVP
jgi:nucleotide-binding universal stress UspA family protein